MKAQTLEYNFEPRLYDDSAILTPFTIYLLLSSVTAAVQRHIESWEVYVRKFHPPPDLPPGCHQRYIEEQSILEWLLLQRANGIPNVKWDTARPDHISGIARVAVCDRQFATIFCQGCRQTYAPSEITVSDWSHRQHKLDLYGGQQAFCPAGHRLSEVIEWIT
jgi:hypothetical protein